MTPELFPIPGFPDYAVSRDARVWSHKSGNWHALALSVNGRWGYLKVKLTRDGQSITMKVHALIATVFLGPRQPGMTVNHKDGNKRNNTPENLEWCTQSENVRHAYAMGLVHLPPKRAPRPKAPRTRKTPEEIRAARIASHRRGEANEHHKLTEADVRELRRLHDEDGLSYGALAIGFGISKPQAMRIAKRLKWAHVA